MKVPVDKSLSETTEIGISVRSFFSGTEAWSQSYDLISAHWDHSNALVSASSLMINYNTAFPCSCFLKLIGLSADQGQRERESAIGFLPTLRFIDYITVVELFREKPHLLSQLLLCVSLRV